jgi:menaquinone-dependent protoporphyrinogen oxidase
MKTLIIYHSRFGGTEKCALRLADYIGSGTTIQRISETTQASIDAADAIIIGASVDKGYLIKPMTEFLAKNPDLGGVRALGVYLCHGEPNGASLLIRCFPATLLAHARVAEAVGGCLDLDKVPNPLRLILGVIGVKKSYDRIDDIALKRVAMVFK